MSSQIEDALALMSKTVPSFFTQPLAQLQAAMGAGFRKRKKISLRGDAMVSTGVLKVGIAIRGPVNRVIKLEPFLKRNDKNNFALAA